MTSLANKVALDVLSRPGTYVMPMGGHETRSMRLLEPEFVGWCRVRTMRNPDIKVAQIFDSEGVLTSEWFRAKGGDWVQGQTPLLAAIKNYLLSLEA